jgi:CRP/FNR family transcriptional regulator
MIEFSELKKLLPQLNSDFLEKIALDSTLFTSESDVILLKTGNYVHSVPLVIKGLVRVSRMDVDKELLLYYLHPGEMCIMSFSACIHNTSSIIEATTLEPTTLLLIPENKLRMWVSGESSFNAYIHSLFNSRYLDLIETIDQLVFYRLDERLLHYLIEKASNIGSNALSITHQQIATEMGTAREVVSRLLRKLELEGKLKVGRNQILLT